MSDYRSLPGVKPQAPKWLEYIYFGVWNQANCARNVTVG